ncbi:MAG: ATP-binding protein [Bacteroidia bacterium]
MEAVQEHGLLVDLDWFREHLALGQAIDLNKLPNLSEKKGRYALYHNKYSRIEKGNRLLVMLGLMQYLDPDFFNQFGLLQKSNRGRFIQDKKTGQLLPTGETFLQFFAGNDVATRMDGFRYLHPENELYKTSVLDLGEVTEGGGAHLGIIKIAAGYVDLFINDVERAPRFSNEFPAQRLLTQLNWDDLWVRPETRNRLEEISTWLNHEKEVRADWRLNKHIKQGFRCLFYGPSGMGKTLAATILGKQLDLEVYRVDLSTVVSKYVGETSKNLNALFNAAEHKRWVLFFDEGDALFGKRTDAAEGTDKNAHYANQEVAFLLQRIENYNGLVIVATNLKNNIDSAFSRRFQQMVYFGPLDKEVAVQFWETHWSELVKRDERIDFNRIVVEYPLSQASVMNVIQRVTFLAVSRGDKVVSLTDFIRCLKDEQLK